MNQYTASEMLRRVASKQCLTSIILLINVCELLVSDCGIGAATASLPACSGSLSSICHYFCNIRVFIFISLNTISLSLNLTSCSWLFWCLLCALTANPPLFPHCLYSQFWAKGGCCSYVLIGNVHSLVRNFESSEVLILWLTFSCPFTTKFICSDYI